MSSETEEPTKEFQQQVETYIAWVNSQLKKRKDTKLVKDLRSDLSDGVLLVTLVEIISGEKIDKVKAPACSFSEKQHNINLIMKFLSIKNIKMHHMTDREIIEGNIKSIMRLILTLAAHFKPSSVGSRKSVSAAAANATAALDIHKRVTSSGGYRRWKSSTPSYDRRQLPASPQSSKMARNQSDMAQFSCTSEGESVILSRLQSSNDAFTSSDEKSMSLNTSGVSPLRDLSSISSEVIISSGGGRNQTVEFIGELSERYDDIESELRSTREMVSLLQNLLLNGEISDQEASALKEKCSSVVSSCDGDESIILRSQLDLCQHENDRLKNELTDARQECRATSATRSAVNSRVQQQDRELLSLKQQILKLNLTNESLKKEKEFLATQVEELKHENRALSNDLTDKNMTIKLLRDEMGVMSSQLKKIGDDSKHKINSVQQLELQVQELRHQLKVVQRYKQSNSKFAGNEMTVIGESLSSLRSNLPPHDSRQHIIDTLEQAVMSLTEQSAKVPEKKHFRHGKDALKRQALTYSPKSRRKKDQSPKVHSTTVIYFMESNMTPVREIVQKRIGDITLRDFKNILQTSGHYRYNFKALDPEFGTVKKEVQHDEDIVPGWEGQIVAWVEKEQSNGSH